MGKDSTQEQILRASKEIAVKFIEAGRLSPGNFADTFKSIYDAIDQTVRGQAHTDTEEPSGDGSGH